MSKAYKGKRDEGWKVEASRNNDRGWAGIRGAKGLSFTPNPSTPSTPPPPISSVITHTTRDDEEFGVSSATSSAVKVHPSRLGLVPTPSTRLRLHERIERDNVRDNGYNKMTQDETRNLRNRLSERDERRDDKWERKNDNARAGDAEEARREDRLVNRLGGKLQDRLTKVDRNDEDRDKNFRSFREDDKGEYHSSRRSGERERGGDLRKRLSMSTSTRGERDHLQNDELDSRRNGERERSARENSRRDEPEARRERYHSPRVSFADEQYAPRINDYVSPRERKEVEESSRRESSRGWSARRENGRGDWDRESAKERRENIVSPKSSNRGWGAKRESLMNGNGLAKVAERKEGEREVRSESGRRDEDVNTRKRGGSLLNYHDHRNDRREEGRGRYNDTERESRRVDYESPTPFRGKDNRDRTDDLRRDENEARERRVERLLGKSWRDDRDERISRLYVRRERSRSPMSPRDVSPRDMREKGRRDDRERDRDDRDRRDRDDRDRRDRVRSVSLERRRRERREAFSPLTIEREREGERVERAERIERPERRTSARPSLDGYRQARSSRDEGEREKKYNARERSRSRSIERRERARTIERSVGGGEKRGREDGREREKDKEEGDRERDRRRKRQRSRSPSPYTKRRHRDEGKDEENEDDGDGPRSAISGKRIKLKVEKDDKDRKRDKDRANLLEFLNQGY